MLPGSPTAFNLTSLVTRRHPPGHAARIGAKPDCEPPRRAERTGNRFVATARKNSPENNRSAEIPGILFPRVPAISASAPVPWKNALPERWENFVLWSD
jgi:hypothetical protein